MDKYAPKDIQQHWADEYLLDFLKVKNLTGYVKANLTVTVKPDNPITRAEFTAVLVRAMGLRSTAAGKSFTDVPKWAWYYDTVRIASAHNIVNGIDATHFGPNQRIRRDEIAAMVARAFANTVSITGQAKTFSDVPSYWAKPYIDKVSQVEIVNRYEGGTFRPAKQATWAEAVKMVYAALRKERSALPDRYALNDPVLNHQNHSAASMTEGRYEQLDRYLDLYMTGQYRAFGEWGTRKLDEFLKAGRTPTAGCTQSYGAEVVEFSNRYGVVRMRWVV